MVCLIKLFFNKKGKTEYSVKDEFRYLKSVSPDMERYINDRLLQQIAWYDRRSGEYQKNTSV